MSALRATYVDGIGCFDSCTFALTGLLPILYWIGWIGSRLKMQCLLLTTYCLEAGSRKCLSNVDKRCHSIASFWSIKESFASAVCTLWHSKLYIIVYHLNLYCLCIFHDCVFSHSCFYGIQRSPSVSFSLSHANANIFTHDRTCLLNLNLNHRIRFIFDNAALTSN